MGRHSGTGAVLLELTLYHASCPLLFLRLGGTEPCDLLQRPRLFFGECRQREHQQCSVPASCQKVLCQRASNPLRPAVAEGVWWVGYPLGAIWMRTSATFPVKRAMARATATGMTKNNKRMLVYVRRPTPSLVVAAASVQ